MLRYLRDASNSITMKIVFGLIMFGFCMWGVGDIIRNYQISRSVIKVGSRSVTVGHFLNELHNIKQDVMQRKIRGQKIDVDAKELAIKRVIAEQSFEGMVERLKMTVSKQTMLAVAKGMSEFQVDGEFNPSMYKEKLRASGMSEHMFLNYVRNNILHEQLIVPVLLSFKVPEFVKNRIKQCYSVQKTLQIWKISPKDIKQSVKITQDEVQEFYASHPEKYQIPEIRNIAICCIPLVKEVEIKESDIDKYLQEHKKLLAPKKIEERTFTVYYFSTQDEAYKGLELINKKRIKQVKRQLMPTVQKYIGTKQQMIEKFGQDISDAAFAIKAVDRTSGVVPFNGRYCVLVLAKVQTKTEHVDKALLRQQVRERLIQENDSGFTYDDGNAVRNKIDDAVASGKTIEEIHKDFNLPSTYLQNIENIQNNANSVTKLSFAILNKQEDIANVLEAIFTTEKGEISQNIEINNCKAVVLINVKNIVPAHLEQLDNIRSVVTRDLQNAREDENVRNMLSSQDDVKNLRTTLMKYKKHISASYSLFDMIMKSKELAHDSKISAIINNGDDAGRLVDCMYTLNKDEWRYFVNKDGDYVVVIVDNAVPGQVSSDCSKFVDNLSGMIASRGVPKCVEQSWQDSFKITIKQKQVDRLAKSVNDQEKE